MESMTMEDADWPDKTFHLCWWSSGKVWRLMTIMMNRINMVTAHELSDFNTTLFQRFLDC
jgi:hypothetical protein